MCSCCDKEQTNDSDALFTIYSGGKCGYVFHDETGDLLYLVKLTKTIFLILQILTSRVPSLFGGRVHPSVSSQFKSLYVWSSS
jgi:hypothetical protein